MANLVIRHPVPRPESKLVLSDDVRIVCNEDGAILLDIKQGRCFSLNPLGAWIWNALKKGDSRNEIFCELCKEFQAVDRMQIRKDLDEFVSSLAASKIIQVTQ